MRDLSTQLRGYMDSFDEPFDPRALIGKAEAVRPTSRHTGQSIGRGFSIAFATAALVLAVVGLVFLGAGFIGDRGQEVATPPRHDSTMPAVPAASIPETSVPEAATPPPQVEGTWTTFSTESGLPAGGMSGVAAGRDGTVWAAQLGSDARLYRFDGTRWARVGDPLGVEYWNWMIATPDGGVAIGVQNQILHFDGERWLDPIYTGCEFAAVVTTDEDSRILGYGSDGDLVDIRYVDGTFEVSRASRGERGGSWPSISTVWDTVDVDSAGNAWFGTIDGAWRFDGQTLELFEFGLEGDCCAPLAVDTADNVWTIIQTHGDLYRLSPDGARTRFTPDDGIPFLHRDESPVILPTADGTVWVFNRTGDAARFDGVVWTSLTPEEAHSAGIPAFGLGGSFGFVDGADGSTWTVRPSAGAIHRFFASTWEVVPASGIEWGRVGADYGTLGMAVAPDGSLWVPTTSGVARFEPAGG